MTLQVLDVGVELSYANGNLQECGYSEDNGSMTMKENVYY